MQIVFMKKILPCGVCAAVPVLKTVSSMSDVPEKPKMPEQTKLFRPSQLPIYDDKEGVCKPKHRLAECPPSFLEEGFGAVRKGAQGLWAEYSSVTSTFNTKISTGYEHSLLMLDYLREESNMMPRLGAVAIGGLTGLIFSLRGGKFKRLIYTSGGALSVAGVCYPKQAQDSLIIAKHYANIGYNFLYGVKPGDANQLEMKLPEIPNMKIPSSMGELLDLVMTTGTSVISTTMNTLGINKKIESSVETDSKGN